MEIIRLNFHLSLEEGDFIYGISLAIYFYYIGVSLFSVWRRLETLHSTWSLQRSVGFHFYLLPPARTASKLFKTGVFWSSRTT